MQLALCPNPVFVIGSPRSGTTILANCLGTHSKLWFSTEGFIFNQLFGPDRLDEVYAFGMGNRGRWLRHEGVSREEFLQSVGIGFNALYTSRSGGKRWIEKTPTNTLMAGVLADMYPQASFVHILRDGRSVVNSMIHFPYWSGWAENFRGSCRTWQRHVCAAMEFAAERPDRCLSVRYDRLVANPEREFEEIYRFLEVDSEVAPVALFRSPRIKSSFGDQSGESSSPSSGSEAWHGWTTEQRQIFLEEVGATMLRFGLMEAQELGQFEQDTGEREGDSQS